MTRIEELRACRDSGQIEDPDWHRLCAETPGLAPSNTRSGESDDSVLLCASDWRAAITTQPAPAEPVEEGCTPADARMLREANHGLAAENDKLRAALRYYADKRHFLIADEDAWDTVSDEAGTATIEDGTVAAMALKGTPLVDEDEEPAQAPAATEAPSEDVFFPCVDDKDNERLKRIEALMQTVFDGKEVPQVWFKRADVLRIVSAAVGASVQPVQASLSDERARFESFWETKYGKKPETWFDAVEKYGLAEVPQGIGDHYYIRNTQDAWECWLASSTPTKGGEAS